MNVATGDSHIGLSLLFVSLVAAFPGLARAAPLAPEPAALTFTRAKGAETCPEPSQVARAVDHRIGRAALVPRAQAKLVVEAVVEPVPGGGFRVRIALMKDDAVIGRRVLEGTEPECRTITDKAVLAIALMIDPEAVLASTAPPAAPPAPPPEAPPTTNRDAPVAHEPPPPPPEPEPRPPWQGDLELAAGVASGLMPSTSPGVFLRGRVLPPGLPLGVELEGAYFPKRTQYETPSQGAHYTLLYAGVGVCSRPPRASRLSASVCAGADFGSMVGQGFGYDQDQEFQANFLAIGVRGRLWLRPVPSLAVVIGPNLTVPLKRDYFVTGRTTGSDELFRMSALSFGLELGAIWEL